MSDPARPVPAPRPLRARPGLLKALAVVFALWVAALLTLYFITVYPQRYGHAAPATAPAGE